MWSFELIGPICRNNAISVLNKLVSDNKHLYELFCIISLKISLAVINWLFLWCATNTQECLYYAMAEWFEIYDKTSLLWHGETCFCVALFMLVFTGQGNPNVNTVYNIMTQYNKGTSCLLLKKKKRFLNNLTVDLTSFPMIPNS